MVSDGKQVALSHYHGLKSKLGENKMNKENLIMKIEGAEHHSDCSCGDCGWVFEEYSEA